VSSGLGDALLYLVSPERTRAGPLASMIGELAEAGVDVVQLRMKDAEAGDVLRAGRSVAAACREAGIPFLVNDRPDVALALEADGVHVGQNDVPPGLARRILPNGIIGLSTHAPGEVEAARRMREIDYLAVGPVFATPTKPGRPAAGLDLVRRVAERPPPQPWFAIGGIDERTVRTVVDAGATRIVVVRAITDAADPPAAAARLRAGLGGR
jgi:thiamine-phosphate pyrophosphorylase